MKEVQKRGQNLCASLAEKPSAGTEKISKRVRKGEENGVEAIPARKLGAVMFLDLLQRRS